MWSRCGCNDSRRFRTSATIGRWILTNLLRAKRIYKREAEIVTQNQIDICSSQIRVIQETTVGVDSGQTLHTVIRLRINVRESGKKGRAHLWVSYLAVYHNATFCFFMRSYISVYTIHNKNTLQT
jgi:hypothetical protein